MVIIDYIAFGGVDEVYLNRVRCISVRHSVCRGFALCIDTKLEL